MCICASPAVLDFWRKKLLGFTTLLYLLLLKGASAYLCYLLIILPISAIEVDVKTMVAYNQFLSLFFIYVEKEWTGNKYHMKKHCSWTQIFADPVLSLSFISVAFMVWNTAAASLITVLLLLSCHWVRLYACICSGWRSKIVSLDFHINISLSCFRPSCLIKPGSGKEWSKFVWNC